MIAKLVLNSLWLRSSPDFVQVVNRITILCSCSPCYSKWYIVIGCKNVRCTEIVRICGELNNVRVFPFYLSKFLKTRLFIVSRCCHSKSPYGRNVLSQSQFCPAVSARRFPNSFRMMGLRTKIKVPAKADEVIPPPSSLLKPAMFTVVVRWIIHHCRLSYFVAEYLTRVRSFQQLLLPVLQYGSTRTWGIELVRFFDRRRSGWRTKSSPRNCGFKTKFKENKLVCGTLVLDYRLSWWSE